MYFSGKNLDQAIIAGARHFDIDPEELAYEPVEKRTGVVTQRRGNVVIKVDPENPRKSAETPDEEPKSAAAESPAPPEEEPEAEAPAPEVEEPSEEEADEGRDEDEDEGVDEDEDEEDQDEDDDDEDDDDEKEAPRRESRRSRRGRGRGRGRSDRSRRRGDDEDEEEEAEPLEIDDRTLDAAADWVERMLDLADLDLDFEVVAGKEGLEIDLQGPDEDLVVEEEGELLRAIQHLLPRVLQSDAGRLIHAKVDCAGFQARQEERLRDLARQTADEVLRKGKPKTLRPMHPADRRIVHLELADDEDVDTESVGGGYFKRVMVRPV
jgi:spoIIIJ-associated protein